MSTSSLTPAPSSQSEPFNPLAPRPETSRPAPKRTYGRARPASPPPDDVPTLFTTASSPPPPPSRAPGDSPSKALLNRWSAGSTSWKDSLVDLGASPDKSQGDDAADVEKMMAQLRKQARMPTASSLRGVDLPSPMTSAVPARISVNALAPTTSSSSLTELTTSPVPSSPPVLARPSGIRRQLQPETSEVTEEETIPVRKAGLAGPHGTGKSRVVASSDEDSSSEVDRLQGDTTETGSTPTPADMARSRRKRRPAVRMRTDSEGSETSSERLVAVSVTEDNSDDEEDGPQAMPAPPRRKTDQERLDNIARILREKPVAQQESSSESDDEDEEQEHERAVVHMPPRRKTDQERLDNIARILREKPVARGESSNSGDAQDQDRKAVGRPASPEQVTHEDQMDDIRRALREKPVAPDSPKAGPSGLFDDEEVMADGSKKSSHAVKPLKKQEHKEMMADIARALREKPIEPYKPVAPQLPMSSWLISANKVLDQVEIQPKVESRPPRLSRSRQSPPTSPSQITPQDEIAAFTPSSTDVNGKFKLSGKVSVVSLPEGLSSPTPIVLHGHRRNPVVPATSEGAEEDDAPIPDIMETLRVNEEAAKKREAIAEKRRLLQERKMAAIRIFTPVGPKMDSDDELSIIPDRAVKSVDKPGSTVLPLVPRRGQDPKAYLSRTSAQPGPSRDRQKLLQLNGKPHHPKEDLTETMAEFAGKTFKHANLRVANGGSKPAGQKTGRDKVITQAQLDEYVKASHQAQAAAIRRKKEEEWGRVKALPQKQKLEVEALAEAAAKAELAGPKWESDEDEESQDDEFVPSGEEEEDEEGDEKIGYSGDEDEGYGEPDEDEVAAEKENLPMRASSRTIDTGDDDEPSPIRQRKPRASRRVAFDSDEETTPKAARQPLAEVPAQNSGTASKNLLGTFVDIAGFGSDSDAASQGFSQLFEATQADGSEDVDAFAALRDQPAGLLAAHELLPQVEITETQVVRDNALIAAEVENAMEAEQADIFPGPAKKQYLNDKGFFTQTRPQAAAYTPVSDDEAEPSFPVGLGGSSALLDPPFEATLENRESLSTTEKGTSDPVMPSPTQGTVPLRRLRRRSSHSQSPEQDAVSDAGTSPTRRPNAFERLMAAPQQRMIGKEQRQQRRSEWVDEQAEESDEDGWMMPGLKGDEDDEGEDDGYVPDLVDDQVIAEEEKRKQDELAAEKARQIEMADDAKREAEARKIIEGQHRTKRRGQDFFSDDEDEEGRPRKRWSKKQRAKRRLWKEDGLDKLEGEENVFKQAYENDLDSDMESVEEMPSPQTFSPSPIKAPREAYTLLRERAKLNRGKNLDYEEQSLDQEIGFSSAGFAGQGDESDLELEVEEQSQFSISRSVRLNNTVAQTVTEGQHTTTTSLSAFRSVESYEAYVRDESQLTRRTGAVGAASVVMNKRDSCSSKNRTGSGGERKLPSRSSTGSSLSGGSILMSKGNRFA